jgi:hypothetical protein
VRKLDYPELHSFAKNKSVSLKKTISAESILELFHLLLSVQAHTQFQELQLELTDLLVEDLNDIWTHIWGSPNFSSSKAYKSLSGQSQIDPIFKWLWKTACQGKHKIFFWLILRDHLSSRNMIRRRGMFLEEYSCVLCQLAVEETTMHLLFHCPFSKDCWKLVNFQYDDNLSIPQLFQAWKSLLNVDFALDLFILFCWGIWMVRNDVIFRNKSPEVDDCKRYITMEALHLLHRSKSRITPHLETWISSNL